MAFDKAVLTSAITMFCVAGAPAQSAPKPLQIPPVLAARFADMAGEWSLSGTVVRQGRKSVEKGSMHCSLMAARTALTCIVNLAGLFGARALRVPYIFGFDKAHKEVWLGEAVPYDGAMAITGTYSEDGLSFTGLEKAGGQTVKVTTTFTGDIGSGKQEEIVRATIGSNPVLAINTTFVKQKQ